MIDEKGLEAAARAMAEGLGDSYDDAFPSKSEWIAERGHRGGRFRDCNEPYQADYDAAARAAITAYLAHLAEAGRVIVPVDATFDMKMAGAEAITADHMRKMADYDAACDCWPAMIAAARPQNEGK